MSSVFLDLRTLSFVLMFVTAFLSMVMLFIWRVHKTYSGYNFWAFSNLVIALGFFFLGLRGTLPDLLTIMLGNTLAFGGVLLVFEGNRKFLGLEARRVFSFGALALHALLLGWFTYIDSNIILRILITSTFLAAVSGRNAFDFHRHQPPGNMLLYKFASATYIAFGILMLMRAALTYAFSDMTDLSAPDWVQSAVFLTFIVFAIIWTFDYLILSNDRLHRELTATQIELEKMATTDFLTGINNDRRFFEIGANEIQRARRFRDPLTVIMFDLDYFKQVNDTHGHAAGDKVLVQVAAVCQKSLRNIDVLGRIGGEEFAVLLPHTDLHGGKITAEHLRATLAETEIEFSSATIKVTASFGVTEFNGADAGIKQILDRADKLLYEAKHKGRNQVVADPDKKTYKNLAAA